MSCNNCGSNRMKRHKPRGALASGFGYKCRDCGHTQKFDGGGHR